MKKLEALFATSRNYKTYREVLATAMPPLVPHIGPEKKWKLFKFRPLTFRSACAEGPICDRGDERDACGQPR